MNAFMIFLPIDPMSVGLEFKSAPLHCTLMPWFQTSASVAEIEQLIRNKCSKYRSLTLISGEPALFGPENDIPVHVLEPNLDLQTLHLELFDALNANGARFLDRYAGPCYQMHVSNHKGRVFGPGMRLTVKKAHLIRPVDEKDLSRKRVAAEIDFG